MFLCGKITAKKSDSTQKKNHFSNIELLRAWSVYGLILVLIIITSPLLPCRDFIQKNLTFFQTDFNFSIMYMQKTVGIYWLTDTGVLIFFGSIIGALFQGAKLKDLFSLLGKTALQLQKTVITVSCLIALSTIMDISGMISILGVALA